MRHRTRFRGWNGRNHACRHGLANDIGDHDDSFVVIDGDLANSTKADILATRHAERFIGVGIAEQNPVGIAFGLTTLGYRPWLSTFGVFLAHRALDQIRLLVSQTGVGRM